MTSFNNHTGARIEIARELANRTDIGSYLKIFNAIETIHGEEGSLPADLIMYSNVVTTRMLEAVERHFGKAVKEKLEECL